MTGQISDEKDLIQNLKDAGCDDETIAQFLLLQSKDKTAELFRLLSKYRRSLLNAIHGDQKRIDILDYLIYSIKKEKEHS